MGKDSRTCCKLPYFPLRVLLLGLCAWAVYTIATGLIYPSISPTSFVISEVQQFIETQARLNFTPNGTLPTAKRSTTLEDHSGKVEHAKTKGHSGKVEHTKIIQKLWSHKRNVFESHKRNLVRSEVSTNIITVKRKNADITKNSLVQKFKLGRDKINNLSDGIKNSRNVAELELKIRNQTVLNGDSVKYLPGYLNVISQRSKYNLLLENGHVSLAVTEHLNRLSTKSASLYSSHISKDVKTILLWTPFYYGWDFVPTGSGAFSNCSETCCEVTYNRSLLPQSHAVVFHVRTMSLLDLPPLRLPHQKWIFFSLEPPPQSYFPGFHFMNGMFNWTMTYRRDSDIVIPYGRVIRDASPNHKTRTEKEWKSLWKRKTRPVVWMVSHCDTYSKREMYVRGLQKHIDVDILGGCGSAVCLYNETFKCLKAFSRRYKFFLAFENSICDDYVTEKFFRALKYDMIPVVLGGADYKSLAPPGSYVNAEDFPSPKALADYLYTVSENLTLFKTYLKWKEDNFVVQDEPSHCALCEKVNSPKSEVMSTYPNMVKWWVENSHCTKWTIQ